MSQLPISIIEDRFRTAEVRQQECNYKSYAAWLHKCGVRTHPNVEIAYFGPSLLGEWGMRSTRSIRKGECLFEIPRHVLMNQSSTMLRSRVKMFHRNHSSKPERKRALQKFREDQWTALILTVMHELSNIDHSFWKPYLDVLPQKLYSPLFWTEEQVQSELKGTAVPRMLGRKSVDQLFERYVLPFTDLFPELFHPEVCKLDVYKRIGSIIMAYSFTEETARGVRMSMVPLADLLNHCTARHNASLFFEFDCLRMIAVRDIALGDQVYNTYGRHSNSELLRRYGFVDVSNPDDDVLLPRRYLCGTLAVAFAGSNQRKLVQAWNDASKKHPANHFRLEAEDAQGIGQFFATLRKSPDSILQHDCCSDDHDHCCPSEDHECDDDSLVSFLQHICCALVENGLCSTSELHMKLASVVKTALSCQLGDYAASHADDVLMIKRAEALQESIVGHECSFAGAVVRESERKVVARIMHVVR